MLHLLVNVARISPLSEDSGGNNTCNSLRSHSMLCKAAYVSKTTMHLAEKLVFRRSESGTRAGFAQAFCAFIETAWREISAPKITSNSMFAAQVWSICFRPIHCAQSESRSRKRLEEAGLTMRNMTAVS